MSDKVRIVWLGPKGACFEEHKDARYAETRAKDLQEYLLAEEWRETVRVIYPSKKDKTEKLKGNLFE